MIKLKSLLTETYCGVVIDDKSRNELLSYFAKHIPEGWEKKAEHMTIDPFKPLTDASKLNQPQQLTVTHIGSSDKAVAVKVSGYNGTTNNAFPHITLAVNRAGGGKPKDSNDIKNWTQLPQPLTISGTIKNI